MDQLNKLPIILFNSYVFEMNVLDGKICGLGAHLILATLKQ